MRNLVVFDMDNTILNGHSQKYFLVYAYEKKMISFFDYLLVLLWFVAYKFHVTDNAKKPLEYLLKKFSGMNREELDTIFTDFFNTKLKEKIFTGAKRKIEEHMQNGDSVYILSNAISPIVYLVGAYLHIPKEYCIATQLTFINNILTSEIQGELCYGENKKRIIQQLLTAHPEYNKTVHFVYADHASDIPLLSLAQNPVAVNPSSKLKEYAENNNIPIVSFS